MHRPKLVKPFGAIYFLALANVKRWCMPTYQAASRKLSPQRCKRRLAMFGHCLADDVLLPGHGVFCGWTRHSRDDNNLIRSSNFDGGFGLQIILTNFVPKLLTIEHKRFYLEIAQDMLNTVRSDLSFLITVTDFW
ncbi:hypothetical protein AVEN_145949-1 [Araneus ventricosus]|uniref:Uncharacterized protein n=1 Tax=Araneus ventricosus TaxID=182803 RepID=A0A4Y2WVF2_ARAVE|nr:hypothetical protein AVEN_255899-1 [Araneus ventricosus]GBO41346.1 hypothetical protein AVEN_21196-1 [Araneus ventricosus]GBO41351.1 hypothetical protein AVEN_140743-1 [Araneus ventricosus]GBO41353.1 hypothetical protein AVEN_145949-1 [Araneus ventricosus]